jgi:hypothetical protein
MIHIGWPQGIMITLLFLGLLIYAVKDGEPRTDKWKFSIKAVDVMIILGLLYWGGFFN